MNWKPPACALKSGRPQRPNSQPNVWDTKRAALAISGGPKFDIRHSRPQGIGAEHTPATVLRSLKSTDPATKGRPGAGGPELELLRQLGQRR
jgi:hypothetical protein